MCGVVLACLFLCQSPDGKMVASGSIDGIINLYDLQSGKLLHTLEGEGHGLVFVSLS